MASNISFSALPRCEIARFVAAQLGGGAAQLRHVEDRIVTEAAFAGGLLGDLTGPAAVEHQRRRIFRMAQIDQHAVELRAAPARRYAFSAASSLSRFCRSSASSPA